MMKEFWHTLTTEWWGILIICVVCAAVWLLLSVLLYKPFFKRFYDVLLSGIAILVFSWLYLILIILGAVKMKGNPFFVQKRPGRRKKLSKKQCERRGVPFGTYGEEKIIKLLKFRTMSNAKDKDGNLLPDDVRLNGYGKLLRKTSLDELPSLINIFKGDISIVGPRPLLVRYLPFYTEEERHRHDIRPGLTGLAQVSGRNYLSWEKIFQYDLLYKKKCSLFFDLKIIFLTAFQIIRQTDVTDKTQGEGIDKTGRKVYDAFDVERTRQNARKEIGSNFWRYDDKDRGKKFELGISNVAVTRFFKSGRNAIKALCKHLSPSGKKALLPIYTCSTVIDPFLSEGWQVEYYDVLPDLKVDVNDLAAKVKSFAPNVVLVHAYFGFDTLSGISECLDEIKTSGITVIEDITQSLFSSFKKCNADYYVSSLRKFFAVPDGGMIQTDNDLSDIVCEGCDPQIEETAKEAFELKRLYLDEADSSVEKSAYRQKYAELNELISENSAVRDISPMSSAICKNADVEVLRTARRANYLYLDERLPKYLDKVTGTPNNDEIPLYYPVYTSSDAARKDLQTYLAERNIYCPIIWPVPNGIESLTENAEYIYSHILCIPIDQRYDTSDMQKIIDALDCYGSTGESHD